MFDVAPDKTRNEVILAAGILLSLLFFIFGWKKLTGFSGTVGYMSMLGVPEPELR